MRRYLACTSTSTMIVYRTATRVADPGVELSRCLTMPVDDIDALTSRLIGLGTLESALADLWSPHRDGRDPRVLTLRTATRWAARALIEAREHPEPMLDAPAERHLRRAMTSSLRLPLPLSVTMQMPQAFAHDGLHPLAYDDAVRRCLAHWRPPRVVVVGLRPTGPTLVAIAAARCEHDGIPVVTTTLRARGHPLDRRYEVDEAWATEIRSQQGALCLVIDDGPGPSGSSITAVTALLESQGHAPERIAVICSHDPDPSTLESPRARATWTRHAREVVPHRDPDFAEDWSAGRWRARLGLPTDRWPAIHPQHERHKGIPADAPGELHKFVGFGSYGAAVSRRARLAAEAGFGVPIVGMRDGYMRMTCLAPATLPGRRGTPALAASLVGYLAWRATAMQTGARADTSGLLELLRTNTRERCGTRFDLALARHERAAQSSPAAPSVIVDGRLLPWEWLQTPQGLVKSDAGEHGDDGFQPGPQDIAWDAAAALVEFAWTDDERAALVEQLAAAMKDRALAARLRWMTPCYLAARLGYTTVAAESLKGSEDGVRFERLSGRYARQLAGSLGVFS